MKAASSGLKSRFLGAIAGVAMLATVGVGVAEAALTYAGDSKLEFLALGPAGLKIVGQYKKEKAASLSVTEKDGSIVLSVPWSSLTTGMGLRDEHMGKYFHTDKHPNVTVEVSRAALTFPEDQKEASGNVKGKVTINGVTKELPINYQVKRTGSDYHVKGTFTVPVSDFKVEIPCYLGQCVNNDVKVRAAFKLRES
ncbi:MAG: hypothetical protein B6A08_07520 [Sorangiineae bacterium NIC37A_2]|jgi:polyisoprenoid-binding protein YceI|nr:MAG: hypothetical protein B6A08_07520 [Sorangiineae bacterium NIC37A_2]